MGHELDINSKGEYSVAATGGAKTMWHKHGQEILAKDSIKVIQKKAGIDFKVLASPCTYQFGKESRVFDGRLILHRSDDGRGLGIVSDTHYNIHQPDQIAGFFDTFLRKNKLRIETAGAVKGGRIIWVMAKLHKDFAFDVLGKDHIDSYVRLQTSFDTSRITDLVATTVRQVCYNTMRMVDVDADKRGYRNSHNSEFDEAGLQRAFGLVGKQHKITAELYNALAKRKVTAKEVQKFFIDTLLLDIEPADLDKVDPKTKKPVVATRTKNQLKALADAFTSGPGSQLKSSQNTAFGLLNAVTYYVDHAASVQDNYKDGTDTARLNAAWFGNGDQIKLDAQYFAAELAGCKQLVEVAA